MNSFGGGFSIGGSNGRTVPIPNARVPNTTVPQFSVPNGSGSNIANSGLNIYALVNMGLHFIIVIAVLLLIFYIVKQLSKGFLPVYKQTDKALELLNERYARGEIDTEDYITRKKTLGYMTEKKTS